MDDRNFTSKIISCEVFVPTPDPDPVLPPVVIPTPEPVPEPTRGYKLHRIGYYISEGKFDRISSDVLSLFTTNNNKIFCLEDEKVWKYDGTTWSSSIIDVEDGDIVDNIHSYIDHTGKLVWEGTDFCKRFWERNKQTNPNRWSFWYKIKPTNKNDDNIKRWQSLRSQSKLRVTTKI